MKISLTVENKNYEANTEWHFEKVREALLKLEDEMRSELIALMEWMKMNDVKTLTVTDNDEEYMQ